MAISFCVTAILRLISVAILRRVIGWFKQKRVGVVKGERQVILGQFKRGKTTLINSLIGKEILPSSVVPLTSIVTILKYGEEVRRLVSMDDGNEKKIRIEELSDYVTEKGNPKNIRGVRCARIAYPSPFLEKGILLVDTPRSGVHLPAQHRNDLRIPGPSGCGIVPHERRRPYLAGGKRTPRHD